MSQQPELQENVVEQQRNRSGSGIPATTAPASGSTQGTANHTSQVETFSIPAPGSDHDHDHRTTITIESQQRQWPQDIWFHSPWQRVLYQPALMYPLQPEEPVPAGGSKTEPNGDASKGSSA